LKLLSKINDLYKEKPAITVLYGISISAALLVTAYFLISRRYAVVRYAKKWLGEEEIAGNMGFLNTKFNELMDAAGFVDGDQWCMLFVRMVYLQKYKNTAYYAQLEKLLTPSTQTTLANFKNDTSGMFEVSQKPKPGAIVIWTQYQNGAPQGYTGHAAIVQHTGKDTFTTIGGNENHVNGQYSEGIVAEKERTYDWNVTNGLRLQAFIYTK